MKIRSLILVTLVLCFLVLLSCVGGAGFVKEQALYRNPEAPVADRAADLLSRMSIEEKAGQMAQVAAEYDPSMKDVASFGIGSVLSGGGGVPRNASPKVWADQYDRFQTAALNSRLGIPIIYGIDAVHGFAHMPGTVIYPHQIGLGAAGDPDLVFRISRATAETMGAVGIDWTFGPCVAVPQDERWGRTYEGFSENPDLVSLLGAAAIRGFQGNNLLLPDTVLACAKHYLADGGTDSGTDQGDALIDEETLRTVHLAPYEAAVEAGVSTIMASFSSWNGIKMHANTYLLKDVLRNELGFEGLLVSDWAAHTQLEGNLRRQIQTAVLAGIDMFMIPDDYRSFIAHLVDLVKDGDIPMARIDEAVSRILTLKFELGLFEDPFAHRELFDVIGSDEHRALGREAVRESVVLLKNEGGLLPLSRDLERIVVAGPRANDIGSQLGGWSLGWQGQTGDVTPGTTVLEAVQAAAGENTDVIFNPQADDITETDVVICVVGEDPYAEFEGDDGELTLGSRDYQILLRALNSDVPVAVILLSGRPLMISSVLEQSEAFLAAWLPGTEGMGIADVLFGDYAPTATLPCAWPENIRQIPIGPFTPQDPEYPQEPLFPISYGLTY